MLGGHLLSVSNIGMPWRYKEDKDNFSSGGDDGKDEKSIINRQNVKIIVMKIKSKCYVKTVDIE
jgi:hypothetical protein